MVLAMVWRMDLQIFLVLMVMLSPPRLLVEAKVAVPFVEANEERLSLRIVDRRLRRTAIRPGFIRTVVPFQVPDIVRKVCLLSFCQWGRLRCTATRARTTDAGS